MQSSADKIDLIIQQNPEIWKSKAMFFSFIKGILRKGWARHPVKLKLINKRRKQIPNPNPKGKKPTVWGSTCEICGQDFVIGDMEVDHKQDETAKLVQLSDIQSCAEMLLCVVEEDLRLICKGCHSIHSYSQKMGISFEEAKSEKEVVAFKLLKVAEQTKVLTEACKYPTIGSNSKQRVEQYREWLKKEKTNGNC